MRIASVHLKNFKRFSDLAISGIPATAKLVVVVGPNGCGKSSLFDALIHWYRQQGHWGIDNEERYFRKDAAQPFDWHKQVEVALHNGEKPARGCLYVRTAYRNEADFSISALQRLGVPTAELRIQRSIQNDMAVKVNYQRLVYDTVSGVYSDANDGKTVKALRDELIGGVCTSLTQVFGDLSLNNISDPLGAGSFTFTKGGARGYHYKNLSGGEKSAFDLLLDMHIQKRYFGDAIYAIDEIDTHLHTRVQGSLLKELVRVLPPNSQLWVTTHSLGVMRAAQELESASPGSVCVIDFDGIDPDAQHELMPSSLGRVTWDKMMAIALDDLSKQIAPKTVVVCEGSAIGNRRKDFDAEIYNRVLGVQFPGLVFVSGGNSDQVKATGVSVQETLARILPSAKFWSLADRDDKSTEEVRILESNRTIVLAERNIESYLFADDVIEALLKRYRRQADLAQAMEIKENAMRDSKARGNPSDDVKSAAGDLYTGLKKLLGLQRCGDRTDTFMRDTMAPLITPGMKSYDAMVVAIVGKLT